MICQKNAAWRRQVAAAGGGRGSGHPGDQLACGVEEEEGDESDRCCDVCRRKTGTETTSANFTTVVS